MKKYRIYSSYKMLHIVTKANSIEEMINVIDSIIYKEDAHYLVVEEDYENNTDIPILSVYGLEEWEQYKNEYFEQEKGKVKVYGRNK